MNNSRRHSLLVSVCVAGFCALATPALAADQSTEAGAVSQSATPTATTAAGPTGPTVGVQGAPAQKLTLSLGGDYSFRGRSYALPRTLITVKGSIPAFVAGQNFEITVKRGSKLIVKKTVGLAKSGTGGAFKLNFRGNRSGQYSIAVDHVDSAELTLSSSHSAHLKVVGNNIKRGAKSVATRLIQRKLSALHYVVPRGGVFDAATGRALLAFRKVNGLSRIEKAGPAVTRKLAAGRGGFKLKRKKAGRHIEVDISRQVMAFANRGRVVRIYHVSTGAAATPTVRGTFHVYRKDPGTNAKGMVKSNYFIRGYAVHGFAQVPIFNASHGCIRVPVPNAASIFAWVRMGTRIDIYG